MNKKLIVLGILMCALMVLTTVAVSAMNNLGESGARLRAYAMYPDDDPSIVSLTPKPVAQGRSFYVCNPTGWVRPDGTPDERYPVSCPNDPGYPAGYEAYATYVEADPGDFFPTEAINFYVGAQENTYWCDPTTDATGARWLLMSVDREPTGWEDWDYALKVSSLGNVAEIYTQDGVAGWPANAAELVFSQTGDHAAFYYGDPLYCVGSGSALVDGGSWTEAPHLRCAHSTANYLSFWEPQSNDFYKILRTPVEDYMAPTTNVLVGEGVIRINEIVMPNGMSSASAELSLSGISNDPTVFTEGGVTPDMWRAIPLVPGDFAGHGDIIVKERNLLGEHIVQMKIDGALMHFLPNMFDSNTLDMLVGKSISVNNYGQIALGVFGENFPEVGNPESALSMNILFQAPAWVDSMRISNIRRGSVRGLYDEVFLGDVILTATVAPNWKGVGPMNLVNKALGVTMITAHDNVDKEHWDVPNMFTTKIWEGAEMSNVVKDVNRVSVDISADIVSFTENKKYFSSDAAYYSGPVILVNNILSAKDIETTWTVVDEAAGYFEGTVTVTYDGRSDAYGVMRGMQTSWWPEVLYDMELTVTSHTANIVPLANSFVLTPESEWVDMYTQMPGIADESMTFAITAHTDPMALPGSWLPPADGSEGNIGPTDQQLEDAVKWAKCLCGHAKDV